MARRTQAAPAVGWGIIRVGVIIIGRILWALSLKIMGMKRVISLAGAEERQWCFIGIYFLKFMKLLLPTQQKEKTPNILLLN